MPKVWFLHEMGMKTSKDMITNVNYTKECPPSGRPWLMSWLLSEKQSWWELDWFKSPESDEGYNCFPQVHTIVVFFEFSIWFGDAISLNVQSILLMLPIGVHCLAKMILGGGSGSCGSSGHKTTRRWDAIPCSQSQIIVFAT
jgi:hypothetical protein